MATPGSEEWAKIFYGAPCKPEPQIRIHIFGADRIIHEAAARHFLRLDLIFKNHAPEYHRLLCNSSDIGTFNCRVIANTTTMSNHSWPICIDLRSQANPRGLAAKESEVWLKAKSAVREAESEGFRWGGRYTTPDPMHFETLLTPEQIKDEFHKDGTHKHEGE